jgi:diguanylate cyclase (GGDEF)-like protein/putative nucleotidyltransferase with HDIG domain
MKWTLNKQLLMPLVAVFLFLTAVGTVVAVHMFTQQAKDMVNEQLRSTSGAVGLLMAQQESELRGLASSAAKVADTDLTVTEPGQLPANESVVQIMAANDLATVQLLSPGGAPLNGVGPVPSLEGFDLNRARTAQALSTINRSGDSIWLLGLAPYKGGEGEILGFVVVGRRLDQRFLDGLVSAIDVGLVLTMGDVSTGSSTAAQYYSPDVTASESVGQPAQVKINGDSYGVLTTELATGAPGSAYLSVLMPTDDIMAGVQTRVVQLVGIAWIGGIFVLLCMFYAAKRVSGPIRRLAARAREISEGSYGQTMEAEGADEIRTLVGSFNQMSLALRESYEELSRLANTDGLTDLGNHRYVQEALARELERAKQNRHSVAVIMMDIDSFKLFNDTHGHAAGDKVLKLVADVIRSLTHKDDVIGRFGGDKFMIIAPRLNRRRGKAIAERIRRRLSEQGVHMDSGQRLPLRLSMGIAVCPDDSTNKEELLAYVDVSLFESKRAGGNTITLANRQPGELAAYQDTTMGVLDGLVRAVDQKDRYTKSHSEENAEYAMLLGRALGLSETTQSALRIAGLLHDIGKIGIPDHILKKPGPLTPEEREIVQRHVVLSNLIIKGIPYAEDVGDAVANHHERWDGGGYPRGLKGEEIPLLGRIMAVVDAYSAITSDRPFRKGQSHRVAVAELRRNAGTQFDPDLAEKFIEVMESRRKEEAAA